MIKTSNKIPLMVMILFFAFSTFFYPPTVAKAFSDQVIQRGATGDDVVELQARLQYIGFYNGTIDGVYGWGTYWSVKKYQDEFGLEVDGLVGPEMKHMLEKSTNFDYEWVHRQFNEGRKFTYYGKTPKEIQSGPSGKKIPPLEQSRRQQRAPEGVETPLQSQPSLPGKASDGTPQPSSPQAPSPGQGQTPPTQQTPGETPSPGPANPGAEIEQPNVEAPTQEGGDEPIPEAEPVPEAAPEQNEPTVEKAINVPEGFSDNDIKLMSNAVYGEARGEPYIGQVAVAAVILNRVNSPTFPNTVSGVIFEPRAFTAVADGQIWLEPNESARRAVLDAINGQDPTGHAMYYFNPDTATSGWIWTRPQIKKIGKHIFCK